MYCDTLYSVAMIGARILDPNEIHFLRALTDARALSCTKGSAAGCLSFRRGLARLHGRLMRGLARNSVGAKKFTVVKTLVADPIAENPKAATALINLCTKLLRDQEADPRAVEDGAFVDKLAECDQQAGTALRPAPSRRRARRNPENERPRHAPPSEPRVLRSNGLSRPKRWARTGR
jgi:hypothetical protein